MKKNISYIFTLLLTISLLQTNESYAKGGTPKQPQASPFKINLSTVIISAATTLILYKVYAWYTWVPNIPKIATKYSRESAIIHSSKNKPDQKEAITNHVITQSKFSGQTFSRVKYMRELTKDIRDIDYYLSNGYKNDTVNCIDIAKTLFNDLKIIRESIISNSDYQKEAQNHEKMELEKENVNLKQQKLSNDFFYFLFSRK